MSSFGLCICSGWQHRMERKWTITVWHCTQGILPEMAGGGMQTTSTNSYPIYEQSLRLLPPYLWSGQKFDTLFMTFAAGTVSLDIIFCWAVSGGLFDNYEKVASSKKHTQYFQTRVLKPNPIYDQCDWKTLPFWGCTYPYSPYRGVVPGIT